MDYINSITEAIGKTPLLKLNKIGKDVGANIFVKLEHLNPSGSYKDRMALAMIEAAEEGKTWNGKKLRPGGTVIEASAGNTAPALAMVAAARGYKAKFCMYRYQCEDDTNLRMRIIKAFGPEVFISSEPSKYLTEEQINEFNKTDPDLIDVIAAKMDCQLMEQNDEGGVWVDQIYNEHNYIGQKSMGYEIYDQLDGQVDAVGCSVAAAGSLYGICKGLEEKGVRPEIVFGVTPHGTENYLSLEKDESTFGEFKVSDTLTNMSEAMGLEKWVQEESIVSRMINDGYPDLMFAVNDEDAREMANRLCQEEGIFCGMSSGANVLIAVEIAKRLGPGKNVITTIVDRRDRYLLESPEERYVV